MSTIFDPNKLSVADYLTIAAALARDVSNRLGDPRFGDRINGEDIRVVVEGCQSAMTLAWNFTQLAEARAKAKAEAKATPP